MLGFCSHLGLRSQPSPISQIMRRCNWCVCRPRQMFAGISCGGWRSNRIWAYHYGSVDGTGINAGRCIRDGYWMFDRNDQTDPNTWCRRGNRKFLVSTRGQLDWLALRVARHWGKNPDWFYTLDLQTRVNLIAEYRIHNETPEQIKKRISDGKRLQLDRIIAKTTGG